MESTENPELQVSSAQEIKKVAEEKKKGKLLKLPSGFVVKVSEPDLTEIIRNGSLPDDLIEIALGMNNEDGTVKEVKEKMNPEKMSRFFEFLTKMVLILVVEPKVVEKDPKDNEIMITDLSFDDKMAIFSEWRLEGKSLENFRKEEPSVNEGVGPTMPEVPEQKTE